MPQGSEIGTHPLTFDTSSRASVTKLWCSTGSRTYSRSSVWSKQMLYRQLIATFSKSLQSGNVVPVLDLVQFLDIGEHMEVQILTFLTLTPCGDEWASSLPGRFSPHPPPPPHHYRGGCWSPESVWMRWRRAGIEHGPSAVHSKDLSLYVAFVSEVKHVTT